MVKKPAQPNQSLIDGLACLEAVALAKEPVGVRELGRLLGLEPTRVNRLLGTLAYLGLTQQNADRKYAPGSGIHVLSAMGLSRSSLLQNALPVIRRLLADRQLPVAVGVLWRRHVCYLFHGRPEHPLEAGLGGHNLYPAQRSSIGRILLAHKLPEEVRALLTDHMDGDLNRLLQDLAEIRRNAFALAPDGKSLAVAIGSSPVAALAFSGFPKRQGRQLVKHLHAAAAEIAARQQTH